MKQTTIHGLLVYTFENLGKYPGILNVTTTRLSGVCEGAYSSLNIAFHVGDERENVLRNRKTLAEALHIGSRAFTCGEQVHGAQVEVVTAKSAGRGAESLEDAFPNTDSLVTDVPGVPLMIQTADCAAVSFYDPRNKAIGVAHAGRKGVELEIVLITIEAMRDNYGTCAENLVVGIGPCIYPCCYPVDLPSQIREQLLSAGVKPENIEESGICTNDNNDIFFSYRADGRKTGRFAHIVMLR